MQGFRTILVAIFGPFVLWGAKVLAAKGFNLTPDQEQTLTEYLVGGGMTVAMIVMRFVTSTPVFKKVTAEFTNASTPTAPASTTITSQSAGAGPAAVKALALLFVAGAIASVGAGLTGCATAGKFITPTVVTIEQGVADVAVATAVSKGIPAAQIKAIAQQLLALDNGTTALSAIEAVVTQKLIAMKLPPGDLAAAQLLTQSLTAAVTAKLSTSTAGSVNANTQVAIADVLNAVITATSFYGV